MRVKRINATMLGQKLDLIVLGISDHSPVDGPRAAKAIASLSDGTWEFVWHLREYPNGWCWSNRHGSPCLLPCRTCKSECSPKDWEDSPLNRKRSAQWSVRS